MEFLIKVKVDKDADLSRVLMHVADEIYEEETDGRVAGGDFRIYEMPTGDLVPDFRQRQAAAVLLMAYDLPVELGEHAKQMMIASLIAPGLNTGHIPNQNEEGRKIALQHARELIDIMLSEIK